MVLEAYLQVYYFLILRLELCPQLLGFRCIRRWLCVPVCLCLRSVAGLFLLRLRGVGIPSRRRP